MSKRCVELALIAAVVAVTLPAAAKPPVSGGDSAGEPVALATPALATDVAGRSFDVVVIGDRVMLPNSLMSPGTKTGKGSGAVGGGRSFLEGAGRLTFSHHGFAAFQPRV